MLLREAATTYGVKTLTLAGAIALCADASAKGDELGERVLARFSPGELYYATPADLVRSVGLTERQAASLCSSVALSQRLRETLPERQECATPADIAALFMADLRWQDREQLCVACLDTKNRLIRTATISLGTLNSSMAHPRECFKAAIMSSAAAVIFAHNHPSGDPTPSREDIELTKALMRAGEVLGIEVLDHVVIGDGVFASLRERGLI